MFLDADFERCDVLRSFGRRGIAYRDISRLFCLRRYWRYSEASIRSFATLVPTLFPSHFIGTKVCSETETYPDDHESNYIYKSNIVPRDHAEACHQCIIYTVPRLKCRTGLESVATLDKTLNDITEKSSKTYISTQKYPDVPARVEIIKVTICR